MDLTSESMIRKIGWYCACEAQLMFAEEERGRLVESMLAEVGVG